MCQQLSFGLTAQSEVDVLRKDGRGLLEKTHCSWATQPWHHLAEVLTMLKCTFNSQSENFAAHKHAGTVALVDSL